MESNKGLNIFLIIMSVFTLIIAIVGTTFAWLNISTMEEPEVIEKVITKAYFTELSYNNGSELLINSGNVNKDYIKTFSIAQSDPSSNETIKYNIKLQVNSNTVSPYVKDLFTYSLIGEGNTNGGKVVSLESSVVPDSGVIIGSGELQGYEAHNYTFKMNLRSNKKDKNFAKNMTGRQFTGNIIVEIIK